MTPGRGVRRSSRGWRGAEHIEGRPPQAKGKKKLPCPHPPSRAGWHRRLAGQGSETSLLPADAAEQVPFHRAPTADVSRLEFSGEAPNEPGNKYRNSYGAGLGVSALPAPPARPLARFPTPASLGKWGPRFSFPVRTRPVRDLGSEPPRRRPDLGTLGRVL